MNTWQRFISATEAGLIYCLEPVIATMVAALFARPDFTDDRRRLSKRNAALVAGPGRRAGGGSHRALRDGTRPSDSLQVANLNQLFFRQAAEAVENAQRLRHVPGKIVVLSQRLGRFLQQRAVRRIGEETSSQQTIRFTSSARGRIKPLVSLWMISAAPFCAEVITGRPAARASRGDVRERVVKCRQQENIGGSVNMGHGDGRRRIDDHELGFTIPELAQGLPGDVVAFALLPRRPRAE